MFHPMRPALAYTYFNKTRRYDFAVWQLQFLWIRPNLNIASLRTFPPCRIQITYVVPMYLDENIIIYPFFKYSCIKLYTPKSMSICKKQTVFRKQTHNKLNFFERSCIKKDYYTFQKLGSIWKLQVLVPDSSVSNTILYLIPRYNWLPQDAIWYSAKVCAL